MAQTPSNLPPAAAQSPTCTNVYVSTEKEAQTLIYATHAGILKPVLRRLSETSQQALRSGFVYVWVQRDDMESSSPGRACRAEMKRFTDGRSWTASRVREGVFLEYDEKYSWAAYDFHNLSKGLPSATLRDILPPRPMDWEPLRRRTYSAYLELPERRKWQMNLYFHESHVQDLSSVDCFEHIKDISIPYQIFSPSLGSTSNSKMAVSSAAPLTFPPSASPVITSTSNSDTPTDDDFLASDELLPCSSPSYIPSLHYEVVSSSIFTLTSYSDEVALAILRGRATSSLSGAVTETQM
ncbi:hypothetical protein ONZ45_g18002 [Pleurotus djamor]|nr:hypothetical protein ONZ45_g18002 [Pleurotus djamor]